MNIQRRDAMKMLLAISASGALAACGDQSKTDTKQDGEDPLLKYAEAGKFLSMQEMAFLTAMAATIIPRTDTPGAVEAGIPQTIQDLLSTWGDDTVRQYWRSGLQSVQAGLKGADGSNDFATLAANAREAVLAKFDAGVYANTIENDFYKDFKSTIGSAYYMSETGATEELIYDPVPGDFKGCIPFSDVGKAWAT
ncbi:MAG: gluconate 2-dehydrogenase subunit 3 family protein [Acidimicrobiales bacterium]|nr:gluconate 2-dehydrogenase subunit 3 family protein [Hyphomonadaceae bacterium]RZV41472.1 MAG: gluconate 2-dehydrogenase subunit 3 family protein [Acidimicrobiales bacterium]